jgi:hypothetical protein
LLFAPLSGKKTACYAYPKDGFRQSAHDDPQWQERAKQEAAFAYLLKPFGEQALLDAVGRCRQEIGSNKRNNQEYP